MNKNNKCCLEIHNSSDSTVKFTFSNEIAYFDARSKGLVQANNSKHFKIDQYLHDTVTPSTLIPKPLVYNKPIDPSKMPRISTLLTQSQMTLMFPPKMTNTHG